MRRVLVTGATGFIGRHLLTSLPGEFEAVAAVRHPGEVEGADRVIPVGDIHRNTPWDEALAGVDAVVHLAATVHMRSKDLAQLEAFREANTRGTIALAEACARNGVRDLIFVSSIAVNGSSTEGRLPFGEGDSLRGNDAYSVSKYEAEEGLRGIAASKGLACTIVRPPLVYGRGARGNVALLSRALARNAPLPLASIVNRRAFVSVSNLTNFIAWRLARPNSGAETFIVADEGHLSTPEFVSAFAAAIERRARLFRFPAGMLASSLKALGRGGLVDSLMASLEVDISKARAAGWRPLHDTRSGLRLEFGVRTVAGRHPGSDRT